MERTVTLRFDARTIVLAGAVLVMLAVWLPWTSLPSFVAGNLARNGWAAGGLFTFVLAVLAALSLLLPWRPWGRVSLPAAGLAALINLIALAAFARVIQHAAVLELDLGAQLGSVGSGLYATFAGAWLMLFGGLADGAPSDSLALNRGWLEYAAWPALITLVFAACLCAWSIGLIVRPYAIDSGPRQAATFGAAPTAYLATPLIGVQLEPLGGASPSSTPTRAPSAPLQLTATATPLPNVTLTQGTPRATRTQPPSSTTPAPSQSATQPRPTATTPGAATPSATPTLTRTAVSSGTPGTPRPTGTRTPTPTLSSPLPTSLSPVATPTPTATETPED